MGRKGNFADKPPKGPGRKARKQPVPALISGAEGKILKMNFHGLK